MKIRDSFKNKKTIFSRNPAQFAGSCTEKSRVNESVKPKFTLSEALFKEEYNEDLNTAERYLDVEIPDSCTYLLSLLPTMRSQDIRLLVQRCRDFYYSVNDIANNYNLEENASKPNNRDGEYSGNLGSELDKLNEELFGNSSVVRIGDTLTSKSGHKIHIDDMSATLTPFEKNAVVTFYYSFEMTDGTAGKSHCSTHDLKNMLQEGLNDIDTDVLTGPNEGPESGLASLLNSAVQEEFKTIQLYNDIAVNARSEGYEDIATVIDEINTEENKHVGQLQELLKTVSPNAQAIDAGNAEGQQLIQSAGATSIAESWESVFQTFKTIEKELNGDGEAITATVDQLYRDNKGNPDYEKAYKKWSEGAKSVKEGIQPNDLAAYVEDAFVKDELDLFVADALRDGSATEATLLTIANKSSNIQVDDMKRAINACKESLHANNSNSTLYNNNATNNVPEETKMKESWKDVYQSFKAVEKELEGDGEAITATVDKLYQDNKHDPNYRIAYDKWASGN